MGIHVERSLEHKDRAVTDEVSQRRGGDSAVHAVADSPQAVARQNLRDAANNSPPVQQLRAFQDMANASSRVRQLAAFRDGANDIPQADGIVQRAIKIENLARSISWRKAYDDYVASEQPLIAKKTGATQEDIEEQLQGYDDRGASFSDSAGLLSALLRDLGAEKPDTEQVSKKVPEHWDDEDEQTVVDSTSLSANQPSPNFFSQSSFSPSYSSSSFSSSSSSSSSSLSQSSLSKIPDLEKGKGEQDSNIILREDQDAFEDDSLQRWLTKEHWKSLLESVDLKDKKKKHYLSTQVNGYWNTYAKKKDKKTPPRTTDEIMSDVGPGLLDEIENAGKSAPHQKLKLYRTMPESEATAILTWYQKQKANVETLIRKSDKLSSNSSLNLKDEDDPGIIPISGHLGDKQQAETYRGSGKAVLEFTLKPGAQSVLFNPKYLAITRSGKGTTSIIAEYEKTQTGNIFPEASKSEGKLSGYIGMKSEGRGPFSLTMGTSDATHLLFQLFIESVKEV